MTKERWDILALISDFPYRYRILRKRELKKDYIKHLKSDSLALDTFLLLIGDKCLQEVNDDVVNCYNLLLKTK